MNNLKLQMSEIDLEPGQEEFINQPGDEEMEYNYHHDVEEPGAGEYDIEAEQPGF
jgi:hypothetical protein